MRDDTRIKKEIVAAGEFALASELAEIGFAKSAARGFPRGYLQLEARNGQIATVLPHIMSHLTDRPWFETFINLSDLRVEQILSAMSRNSLYSRRLPPTVTESMLHLAGVPRRLDWSMGSTGEVPSIAKKVGGAVKSNGIEWVEWVSNRNNLLDNLRFGVDHLRYAVASLLYGSELHSYQALIYFASQQATRGGHTAESWMRLVPNLLEIQESNFEVDTPLPPFPYTRIPRGAGFYVPSTFPGEKVTPAESDAGLANLIRISRGRLDGLLRPNGTTSDPADREVTAPVLRVPLTNEITGDICLLVMRGVVDSVIRFLPMVGLTCWPVQRLIQDILGTFEFRDRMARDRLQPYSCRTFLHHLAGVPYGDGWAIQPGGDIGPALDRIAQLIEDVALPWMRERASLEAVLQEMLPFADMPHTEFMIAGAYALMGERQQMEYQIERSLKGTYLKFTLEFDLYRRRIIEQLADGLRSLLDSGEINRYRTLGPDPAGLSFLELWRNRKPFDGKARKQN